MKKSILFASLAFLALVSCAKEEKNQEPENTDPYYIRATIDGQAVEARGSNDQICQRNYGVCFSLGSAFDNDEKEIAINNDQFAGFSIDGLIAREGDTFSFNDQRSLYGEFSWSLNGEKFSSERADSTLKEQGWLYLQEVTRTDSVEGWGEAALIRGEFNCSITNDSRSETKTVTGGSFYVRVIESI